jgi:hypothetical protein
MDSLRALHAPLRQKICMAKYTICAHYSFTERIEEFAWEEVMALVHHHEPDRSRDLALVALALVVFGIIAAAVPCLKFCVDGVFAVFQ